MEDTVTWYVIFIVQRLFTFKQLIFSPDRFLNINSNFFSCKENEFECSDTTCISLSWKCDRHIDCTDGSDEIECGKYFSRRKVVSTEKIIIDESKSI